MAFKVGDIVQLKSGGPAMTVVALHTPTSLHTSWFAGHKNEKAFFHPDALVVFVDDKKK
ncbi:DUF2158 domain-containing protein [Mesorhizobium sp. WSM1293]|uniref:YodC family protein n=1 Tax=Mesorhizobium sp. WSM1293 TaxID=1040984 RepID=UPI000A040D23|nr:DUF2158 domain-containing protein [Mesorhizobium sp. WSM1293]